MRSEQPWPPCAFRSELSRALDWVMQSPEWAWPYRVWRVAQRIALLTGEPAEQVEALLWVFLPTQDGGAS